MSEPKRSIFPDHKHRFEVAVHRFSLLREKNILTDAVILSSENKRFNVHRVVMAGTSKYFFSNLLKANDLDTMVGCPSFHYPYQLSIDATALETVIQFCYSGAIELTIQNVEMVLVGAMELEIDSLVSVCCETLDEILSINNCIRLLEIADKHKLMTLKENALAVMSEVLPQVTELPEFLKLSGPQTLWLLGQLSTSGHRGEIFGNLLDSVSDYESLFTSLQSNGDAQSTFRAAFIAGFLACSKMDTARKQTVNQAENHLPDDDAYEDDSTSQSEVESETEFEDFQDSICDEQQLLVHTLVILKRKTIELHTFHENERKWGRSICQIHIDSYRDTTIIPVNDQRMVIFHLQSGSISHAELLTLETAAVDRVTLPPCHVENTNFALFCHMNDKIYCFSRVDQHYFHRLDLKTKAWSNDNIHNVMDAKFIVGLKDELFFLGCGYNRTMVRSYHIVQRKWTARGNLLNERKEICFKAIALNESIYVVVSLFDSEKIYNGTEFLIQRYDSSVEGWFIIKRVYYTHFVDCFNLGVAGNCLYLFYGDGEVQIYNEERNDWHRGPAIDYNVSDGSMRHYAIKPISTERKGDNSCY